MQTIWQRVPTAITQIRFGLRSCSPLSQAAVVQKQKQREIVVIAVYRSSEIAV